MNTIWTIAKDELRYWRRSRVTQIMLVVLVLISVASAFVSSTQLSALAADQAAQQTEADEILRAQPDRHPHRMVHYGHYVYRTPSPLAVVDPGIIPFAGNSVFLEGHRRNTATFVAARETGTLARFGALSPAFSLQVLTPLLLILCGYSLIAREQESGTIRQLVAHGVDTRYLLLGKTLALLLAAGIALVPMLVTGLMSSLQNPGALGPLVLILLGYSLYLGLWTGLVVAISALSRSSAFALILLLGIWTTSTILIPRVSTNVAEFAFPAPSQAETYLAISEALRTAGDGHNASDPAFTALRENTLRQYGVESIEELPINYRGLDALQSEEADAEVYNTYAREKMASERRQSALVNLFGLASPMIAVRNLSMILAETDLESHHRFLESAESYRYEMVQHYNRLHMNELDYADDRARSVDAGAEQRTRISAENWAALPEFTLTPATLPDRAGRIGFSGLLLLSWLLLVCLFCRVATRRMA